MASKTIYKGKKRSTTQGRTQNTRNPQKDSHTVMVLRVPPRYGWAAPRLRTTLRFYKSIGISQNGFPQANLRFSPTFAYDVDPVLGSTNMPGFSEYGGLYYNYRVNGFKIKCRVSNREAFPVIAYICPVNQDPGANHSLANAQAYLANTNSKSVMLGAISGNAEGKLATRVAVPVYGGAANMGVVDYYVGSVAGTSPTNNLWIDCGVVSDTSNLTALGVYFEIMIDVDIEFFELKNPAN